MYMVIGLFTIMILVLLGIRYVISANYKFNAAPNLKSYPVYRVIDGVSIGPNLYGDLNTRSCVSVLNVSNGIVTFIYVNPEYNNATCTVPVKSFLESFHKFPNGCDFCDVGK